jgi:hypothetical protein
MSQAGRLAAHLTALACAVALAGCGLGEGEARTGVELLVTRDYGGHQMARMASDDVREGDTVMRLLDRSVEIRTRHGGGFVQSIDGLPGGREDGRPVDWFFYVNGIESGEGAASVRVGDGDVIWWDHRDWGTAMRVPAVVGSFPAPFLSGNEEGKRAPIRVDCDSDAERECDEVVSRLAAAGITRTGRGAINQPAGEVVLRVVVGTWDSVRRDRAAGSLGQGPESSGVFARFSEGELELLDPQGRVARTLGAGSGLIAATRTGEQLPTWIVTGTDEAGVAAAAATLSEEALRSRYAVAVAGGRIFGVPETDPTPPNEPEPR